MSSAVPIGTFLLVACFIMEIVGLATQYWMVVGHSSGLVQSHAGLFKICYEVLNQEACFYYLQYAEDFLNGKTYLTVHVCVLNDLLFSRFIIYMWNLHMLQKLKKQTNQELMFVCIKIYCLLSKMKYLGVHVVFN